MNLNHIAKKPFFDLFWKAPCMPIMARLALADVANYNKSQNRWGPNAGIRFKQLLSLPHNKGLEPAVKNVIDIQQDGNHITQLLTLSDLIQLGGYCAIQYCGGPTIPFKMGRKDIQSVKQTEYEELHDEMTPSQLRAHFNKITVKTDQQIVALMGWRTIDMRNQSPSGRWTKNPYKFDNSYFKELLIHENSMYLQTHTDLSLVQDEGFRKYVEQFANDQQLFFDEFQKAYSKLSESGCDDLLGQY